MTDSEFEVNVMVHKWFVKRMQKNYMEFLLMALFDCMKYLGSSDQSRMAYKNLFGSLSKDKLIHIDPPSSDLKVVPSE